MKTVEVSTRGRVVIPMEIRRKHHIRAGTIVEFSEGHFGAIVLTIQKHAVARRLGRKRVAGKITKKGKA